MHAPKFPWENFCEEPRNLEIRESFLPQKFRAIRYIVWSINEDFDDYLIIPIWSSWSPDFEVT